MSFQAKNLVADLLGKSVGSTVCAVSTVAVKKLDARIGAKLPMVGIATIARLVFRLHREQSFMAPEYRFRNGFCSCQEYVGETEFFLQNSVSQNLFALSFDMSHFFKCFAAIYRSRDLENPP